MSLNLRYMKSWPLPGDGARPASLPGSGTVVGSPFRPRHIACALALFLALSLTLPFMAPPVLAVSGDITGDSVNVRSGPGTENGVIGSLDSDATVTILGNSNGWYKIQTGSITGWVIGDYCKVIPVSVTVIETVVNVRKGPGTNYDSYGQVAQGTVFTLLDVSGEWYKIQAASGTIGYVRSDLVSEGSAPASNQASDSVANPVADSSSSTPPVVPRVVLDGRQLGFGIDPSFESGRLLVPLRAIFEAMGATVTWNQETQTAGAVRGNVTVIMPLNSTTPSVNGQPWTLDVPAKVVNNVTLAPVRFVAEAFGGKVAWDGSTYIAYISSPDDNSVVTVPDSTVDPNSNSSSDSSSNPNGDPAVDSSASPDGDSTVPSAGQVTVTVEAISGGVVVTMTGDGFMHVVFKEGSGQLTYTIKNKTLPGAFSISQPLGTGSVTVTGTNTTAGASIDIKYPAGHPYTWVTEADGAIEVVTFSL